MNIAEGGNATFQVKLSANPGQLVSVSIGHDSGDTDLTVVSGLTLDFDSNTWKKEHQVTVASAEDGDNSNGQATFALSAADDTPTTYVKVIEQDNDGDTSERVVIDPFSRIEGHLRVEVEVHGVKVANLDPFANA